MFDYKKAIQVINWLAIKAGGKINKQKLLCLIFLADREHMRRYGRFICGGSYHFESFAPIQLEMKNLIDYPEAHDFTIFGLVQLFFEYDDITQTITSLAPVYEEEFSESDMEILEMIWNIFGKFNSSELINIVHEFPEWKNWRMKLGKFGDYSIHNELFFENFDEKSKQKLMEYGIPVDQLILPKEDLETVKDYVLNGEG